MLRFIVALLFSTPVFAQPVETGDHFRASNLVEIVRLDSTIKLDIRYATSNNFMKRPMYSQARAFLQLPAAKAFVQVHKKLKLQGLGLLVFDSYRPWSVTKAFWDETPRSKRIYVANPKKGSKHNRGCAVDVSLFDLSTGLEVEMPSPYDAFTENAAAEYPGGTEKQRRFRSILRSAMEAGGFFVNPDEWWHFDYSDWRNYRVQDIPFDKIK